MKNYDIKRIKYKDKNALIIFATSHENPILYLNDIEKKLNKTKKEIEIIFDLFLSAGDKKRRYYKTLFNGSKILENEIHLIDVNINDELRKISANYHKNNHKYLEISLLSNIQKEIVKQGIVI